MNHIISGIICVLFGVWGIIVWWYEFGAVMRGMLPFALLAFGVIGIIAGIQAQKEEASDSSDDVNTAEEEVVE